MSADQRIRSIAIVGGGTAGWIAASTLARKVGRLCTITLVESADIPTVGVGEATIPPIVDFLRVLDIDQQDFMQHTQSTIKLAIRFNDWHHVGHRYWHPFGPFGVFIDRLPFHHYWQKAQATGLDVDLSHFNLEIALAEQNKFIYPTNTLGIAQSLRYAMHFDAGLVARYLRAYSERLGVRRLERHVVGATQHADGSVASITFKEGEPLHADLFIDCTGFRGLLIEDTLKTGYVDWTPFLPNDRAVAMQVPNQIPRGPYTSATARAAGWQWKIPLQHRVGTGYVYSSQHISDDDALKDLMSIPGNAEPLTEPRFIKFTAGHRRAFWNKNVVALGLGSGFIEPLESTSIHLICSGVYNLLDHFPDRSFDAVNIADYNKTMIEEFERVRDFIVLHYCTSARDDSSYWQHVREMKVPDALQERLDLYAHTGRIYPHRHEVFTELSWFFVMHGMGLKPRAYDPLVDAVDWEQVKKIMHGIRQKTAAEVAASPTHDSFFPERADSPLPQWRGWERRTTSN